MANDLDDLPLDLFTSDMSIKTGILRIAQVFRWLGAIALIALVALNVVFLFNLFGISGEGNFGPIIVGLIMFAICRTVAWVLEGFVRD